jgi:Cdc6-like AAA superfamily ATPase
VLGSSAATGKTSLIQLIKEKVLQEDGNANVIRINLNPMDTVDDLMVLLKEKGPNFRDTEKLQKLKNTWLLLDDAQNCYERTFDPF